MSPKKNIQNTIPPHPENPFRVPEGYFAGVQQRVMERIRAEANDEKAQKDTQKEAQQGFRITKPGHIPAPGSGENVHAQDTAVQEVSRRKKIYLQPYFSLAAAITGVALVVYIVLQSVLGARAADEAYDIAMLDRAGVTNDESVLAEAYLPEDEDAAYSEWDEEAITYLASNEVDLINLLENQ